VANPLVVVLGGTRSGKSRFGLVRARELAGGRPVTYLATARAGDPELDDRIRRHRLERPDDWPTIEVGADLAGAITSAGRVPILLDGLTLWLSALVGERLDDIDPLLDGPVAAALFALDRHPEPAVIVSDELGLGMVPLEPLSRAFRDLQGITHQRLTALADEVHFTFAGLPLRLK
jgi:adenosylcobinamide kinase/adenosylcobinamide-phosphate guanylyltransferase